jgi:hexosaminidase
LQLLPPEIFSTNVVAENWQVPCVHIRDWPRFPWRGLMLDVSRHFFNKSEVEAVLDEMALYKLNRFHWHLVDDDGWRLEVKDYPRLTQIGAWRDNISLPRTHKPGQGPSAHPAWAAATSDKYTADRRYGGFYTPSDIREVVAYAAARQITVVPEIEMPGHSGAANASYPWLGVSGKPYNMLAPGKFHGGVLNVANPNTIKFEENVLKEVFQLFPGPYVHIGGDEVAAGVWDTNAACRALMQREGFTNDDQLESYFLRQIGAFVGAHHKTLIGWSEIAKGGLGTNAVVMDWIGGAAQAAEAGHDAIMTPQPYCYLDHYQSTNHAAEPLAIGGYIPLQQVSSLGPMPTNLPAQFQSHILGPQANLWTEYVASLPHVQYMIFPRECALAEVGWSAKNARHWPDFQRRLAADEQRLDELGVHYRPGMAEPILKSFVK